MLIEKVDLRQKLKAFREREISEAAILEQVKSLLKKDSEEKNSELLQRIRNEASADENPFNLDLLTSGRIFHISHIKYICITYRLRFLETRYFKAPIPEEACNEIREIERIHDLTLKGFKIVAPSKSFQLENADDPILFAPIGNGYYYLIHKWGNDLTPFRKLMVWPLKNMENLMIFTLIFSLATTFVLRALFFSQYQESAQFIMLFLFTFKSMVALLVFSGVALGKNFNTGIWNSKYYNA
ncbi:hypothetical protein [Salinimicrobium sp. GXAS 041]|uniref:hypothetical protein n=1 Tax=Salinimicrobium sp. GXAS 041 TaxID=3400806 RepID=UPI003C79562D